MSATRTARTSSPIAMTPETRASRRRRLARGRDAAESARGDVNAAGRSIVAVMAVLALCVWASLHGKIHGLTDLGHALDDLVLPGRTMSEPRIVIVGFPSAQILDITGP